MNDFRPTPQESYEWLLGQLHGKQKWLDEFSTGKRARPEFEVEQKRRDLAFLTYFCKSYEEMLARKSG